MMKRPYPALGLVMSNFISFVLFYFDFFVLFLFDSFRFDLFGFSVCFLFHFLLYRDPNWLIFLLEITQSSIKRCDCSYVRRTLNSNV